MPLSHAPGHSQCDFGEAVAVIGGVGAQGALLRAGPASQRRLLCEGLSRGDHRGVSGRPPVGFAFLGGVPQRVLYDNTKLAVARILGDGRSSTLRKI